MEKKKQAYQWLDEANAPVFNRRGYLFLPGYPIIVQWMVFMPAMNDQNIC